MNQPYNRPHTRSFGQPFGGPAQGYPGLSDPFSAGGFPQGAPQNLPAVIPGGSQAFEAAVAPAAKSGGFSLANIGELKGMIDRMGGIDGIVSMMTKVQKVVGSMQQMAPMIKLLVGSLGKKKTAVASASSDSEWRPKRRASRRRSSRSRSRRRSGSPRRSGSSRSRTPNKRR